MIRSNAGVFHVFHIRVGLGISSIALFMTFQKWVLFHGRPWRPGPLSGALSSAMFQQSAQNPTAEAVSRKPGEMLYSHFKQIYLVDHPT